MQAPATPTATSTSDSDIPQPDYSSILYSVRGLLSQHMDSHTRAAWRATCRYARDAVYEVTRSLQWQGDMFPTADSMAVLAKLPLLRHLDVATMQPGLLAAFPRLLPPSLALESLALASRGAPYGLSPLSAFTSLRTLSISVTFDPSPDFAPLASLPALHTLHLTLAFYDDDTVSLLCLSRFPALRTLELTLQPHTDCVNLSTLALCSTLCTLSIALRSHADIFLPAAPRTLHTLALDCCGGSDLLSALETCRSPHTLRLFRCPDLSELSGLIHCPDLRMLHLHDCPNLSDFSGIGLCPELCDLNLAGCVWLAASDLALLASCTALRTLTLPTCLQTQLPAALSSNVLLQVMYDEP